MESNPRTGYAATVPQIPESTEQDRQVDLLERFQAEHPELRDAIEIFGVASAVYDQAAALAEPPTDTASNLNVSG